MRSIWLLSLLPVMSIILTACPGKMKKSSHPPAIRKVKGDPYVFVKNTKMNGNRPVPAALLADGARFDLNVSGFVEAEQSRAAFSEVKENQNPEVRERKKKDAAPPKSEDEIIGRQVGEHYVISGRAFDSQFEFVFVDTPPGGGWLLDHVKVNGKTDTLTDETSVLHTSVAGDGTAFNILFHGKEAGERSILSFTFIKKSGVALPERSTFGGFFYMFGQDKKLHWPKFKRLNLSTCMTGEPEAYVWLPEKAVRDWQRALEKRLQLTSERVYGCPPFSDLNVQTVNYIHGWIEIEGETATLGVTTVLANLERQELIDGDVMIFLEEVQEILNAINPAVKVNNEVFAGHEDVQKLMYGTVLHEVGHVLGLHHKFDGKEPSIMSYEKEFELKPYDIRAIQALYE